MTTQTVAPLWKDLIEIPEHRSTFVLKLTEGIDNAHETVDKYVVTPSIAQRFDQTLSLIDTAVKSSQSQGAFLHGSFGSGKSHFMAVLNLLLKGFGPARSIEALTDVVVKHAWMKERKFLMIPYHMLGAASMETAILGGYVDYVETHHPDARLPGVFLADSILENAESLRTKMGDTTFFTELNAGASSAASGGWGELEVGWDSQSYEVAREAGPRSAQREKLVGDVVRYLLPSVRDSARAGTEQKFVSFDEGLSIISRHAAELGYDGLILFLDELILWLSGKAADVKFLRQELDKVPKLVEAQHADRPIPIISFVARQRDLREMLGDAMIGEERTRLGLSVEWWQGRFDTVELEDRNLPIIASERLLRPKNLEAREQIRQSFDRFASGLKKTSRDTMLTTRHDEKDFGLVYPFSPALVQALIVLSTTLQRDRTALKLMQTLLIRKRDELRLGDVIPVGDLWDVIAEGDEPMNEFMRRMMRTARRLWEHKLHPVLVRQHGIDPTEPGAVVDPTAAGHFQNDARLLKTMLIAALVPKLEVFEELTVERLVALNHGSVRAPIPGAEQGMAMRKLSNWASEVNEISLQGTTNPVLQIRLEDVDIEPLLKQADNVDSRANRRRKVKDLLYGWLGLTENHALRADYNLEWRGARRTVHIAYGNVREMSSERLTSDGEHWLIVVDYPFDEGTHGPADDRAVLNEYREGHRSESDTIAWLPSFIDAKGKELLGRLLKIEDVLARFDEYASNLRQEDRPIARTMLENNKRAVESRLELALHAAYGLSRDDTQLIDDSKTIPDHLHTLKRGFTPTIPFGKSFPDALEALARQAMVAKYPAAARIPDEALRAREVQKLYDVIRDSIEAEDNRAFVESAALRRQMVHYAEPLKLGTQGETHFVYKRFWSDEIHQRLQPGDAPISVGNIYALLDPPDASTGLPHVLKDLIVLAFADMEDMLVSRHGQEFDAAIGTLRPDDSLERRRLPNEATWNRACELAEAVFNVRPPRMRNARNVQHLAREISTAATPSRLAGLQIADRLTQVCATHLGLTHDIVAATKRHAIARQMRELLLATECDEPTALIEALVAVAVGEHDRKAIQTAMAKAVHNLAILNDPSLWNVIGKLANKQELSVAERGLITEAEQILASPEHATHLETLRNLEKRIIDLVFVVPPQPPRPDPTPPPPPTDSFTITDDTASAQAAIDWLHTQLQTHAGKKIVVSVRVEE